MPTYQYNVPATGPNGVSNAFLNPNEIYSSIFNMIISQDLFADNFKHFSPLVERYRVDGTLYGDTKLYYATDCIFPKDWGADAEAPNLLQLHRAASPIVQAITLDRFKQIAITTDDYLSKRAWTEAGSFAKFTSLLKGKTVESKKIYDSRLIKTFIGTHKAAGAGQNISITVSTIQGATTEETNRLVAQTVATRIADLFDELADETRKFNDYDMLRNYSADDFDIIWNSVWANKFRYMDLPSLFHKDGIQTRLDGDKLQSAYFGNINTVATAGNATGTVRALDAMEFDHNGTHYQLYPGDAIPEGYQAPANTSYTVDDKNICKIVHKKAVAYMSAFETTTSFFNAKSLTDTQFLTFGYSSPVQVKNYSFISIASDA